MKEGYTEEDICKIYRNADEKQDRIQLLHELTLYKRETIVEILEKYGYITENKKKDMQKKIREEKFLELYKLNMSDRQISKALKINSNEIGRIRNGLGLPPVNCNLQKKIEFVELLNKGVPLTEIASKLKVSQSAVYNWNKQLKESE